MSTPESETTEPTGAKGQGSDESATPFSPSKDDETPVGDTDQHSKVDHGTDPAKAIKRDNAGHE